VLSHFDFTAVFYSAALKINYSILIDALLGSMNIKANFGQNGTSQTLNRQWYDPFSSPAKSPMINVV
jgi:hypothetical protein